MNKKKSGQKVVDECLHILMEQSKQGTQKWLKQSRITSLNLRNVKALEIISLSNYMFQKMLIGQLYEPNQLLTLVIQKSQNQKCYEYARLLKHFSLWDYEFQYIYRVAIGQQLQKLGLYLRVKETVVRSEYNRSKKQLLSGITAQMEEWVNLARIIFKEKDQDDIIDQFTTVVRNHYVKVKKSQSDRINGAEFLKICQIIDSAQASSLPPQTSTQNRTNPAKEVDEMANFFEKTVINGLSTQDKQLIRILSYSDKNIARMLEEKHTKMVNLIGQEVNRLRKDINREKERYVDVVKQKNGLIRFIERLKEKTLRYVLNRSEASQIQLLQQLQNFNKTYNPKSKDVDRTMDTINNRRLIEIIEREQLEPDQG